MSQHGLHPMPKLDDDDDPIPDRNASSVSDEQSTSNAAVVSPPQRNSKDVSSLGKRPVPSIADEDDPLNQVAPESKRQKGPSQIDDDVVPTNAPPIASGPVSLETVTSGTPAPAMSDQMHAVLARLSMSPLLLHMLQHLGAIIPALVHLDSIKDRRGLLSMQPRVRSLLPRLQMIHDANNKPPADPPFSSEIHEQMKHMSPEQQSRTPETHQIAHLERLIRETYREGLDYDSMRHLVKHDPTGSLDKLRRALPSTGMKPFKPVPTKNTAKAKKAESLFLSEVDKAQLVKSTKLRSQDALSVKKIKAAIKGLDYTAQIRILAPAVVVLRDNTMLILGIAERAVASSEPSAGRELAQRLLKWFEDQGNSSSLPRISCFCAPVNKALSYRSRLEDRIHLMPAVTRLISQLDAGTFRVLQAKSNKPKQWSHCFACKLFDTYSGSPKPQGARICSLQKTDYGSEKCQGCTDAKLPWCFIPCVEHQELMEFWLAFTHEEVHMSRQHLITHLKNLLPLDCKACAVRQLDEHSALSDGDSDRDDADYEDASRDTSTASESDESDSDKMDVDEAAQQVQPQVTASITNTEDTLTATEGDKMDVDEAAQQVQPQVKASNPKPKGTNISNFVKRVTNTSFTQAADVDAMFTGEDWQALVGSSVKSSTKSTRKARIREALQARLDAIPETGREQEPEFTVARNLQHALSTYVERRITKMSEQLS